MPLEDGQGMFDIVAKAVIQCEHRERGIPPTFGNQFAHILKTGKTVAIRLETQDRLLQKIRCDLKMPVWVKAFRLIGAHMMKREDDAEAPRASHQPKFLGKVRDDQTTGDRHAPDIAHACLMSPRSDCSTYSPIAGKSRA